MTDTIINFFHLLATSVWIGGAMFIHVSLQPSLRSIDPQESGKLMGIISKRFSITAWICTIVLLVTGLLKTPSGMLADASSDLGIILLVKHVFVLAVIVGGLVIALGIVPRLRAHAPKLGEAPSPEFLRHQKRLMRFSTANTVYGLVILACASMLW